MYKYNIFSEFSASIQLNWMKSDACPTLIFGPIWDCVYDLYYWYQFMAQNHKFDVDLLMWIESLAAFHMLWLWVLVDCQCFKTCIFIDVEIEIEKFSCYEDENEIYQSV